MERKVAVKRLRPGLVEDARFLKLFRSEAKVAAQLNHPHILSVYDWAEDDGLYLVTELLSGGTLQQMLKSVGSLSIAQATHVGLQAAKGLAAAHAQGLIHRDIKPANIIFDSASRLRIADFGVARAVAEASWTEQTGAFIGTARYAAPEQVDAKHVDYKADFYSLGLCICEMVTGEVPLRGPTGFASLLHRQEENLEATTETYGPLAEVVGAICRSDPQERITSEEFIGALIDVEKSLPPAEPLPLCRLSEAELSLDLTMLNGSEKPKFSFEADRQAIKTSSENDLTAIHSEVSIKKRLLVGFFIAASVAIVGVYGFKQFMQQDTIRLESLSANLPQAPRADDYIGEDIDLLQQAADDYGWQLVISEKRADDTVKGEILEQSVASGTPIKSQAKMAVVISAGKPLKTLPQLVGISENEALEALSSAGFRPGSVKKVASETVAVGEVMAAAAGGETLGERVQVESGTKVDIEVSSGPAKAEVPSLVGLTPEEAAEKLKGLSLLYEPGSEFSETTAEGKVARSEPVAGTELEKGTPVKVIVSKGKPFVKVPSVNDLKYEQALKKLTDLGLKTELAYDDKPVTVVAVLPKAGEQVRKGSVVKIYTIPQ